MTGTALEVFEALIVQELWVSMTGVEVAKVWGSRVHLVLRG